MNERDELAEILFEQDPFQTKGDARDVADALLAAGYRKPHIIDNADEVEALPEGSFVMDSEPDLLAKRKGKWVSPKYADDSFFSRELDFPVTVLNIPEAQ